MTITVPASKMVNGKRWIATRLLNGDELGSQPGRIVKREHNLEELYGVSAEQIVAVNGASWTTPSINAWVLATGGVKLSNGQPVFASTSIILLPEGGPRAPALELVPPPAKSSGANILAILFGAGVGSRVAGKPGAALGAGIAYLLTKGR